MVGRLPWFEARPPGVVERTAAQQGDTLMNILDHLMAEHRKVEDLLERLKETEEGAERRTLFDELASSLDTHMRVEERYIYPMIVDLIGRSEADDAADEIGRAHV